MPREESNAMPETSLPDPLPTDVLARCAALPPKPAPVTLSGSIVRLVPLDLDRDVGALHAVSNGEPARVGERAVGAYDAEALIWRYLFAGPFADAKELEAVLRAQVEAPDGRCLCVRDAATDRPIGVVNYMNNAPEHLKVELGSIWYSPLAQRTGANTEATYLLLRHAFGLGYRRLEWKCNARNERSRRAALRMGFRFEGVQEAHMVVKGRNRDTAWFRILDREWPEVQTHLEGLLRPGSA
jgi:RimJ/RimL family protein N-acetyltransferase